MAQKYVRKSLKVTLLKNFSVLKMTAFCFEQKLLK